MDPTTLAATGRRFLLLGRPRPACPSLPERIKEITDIAHTAGQEGVDSLADAAYVLNKAALVASDCGLANLAADLCWQHINIYRAADRWLTVLQARHLLEPVLNLARLQIRANSGDQAMRLLAAMYRAITTNTDLLVDGHTLPLADLIGTLREHHELREWVWLHYLGDGVRTLTLAGRWNDAVTHAQAHRGIGLHLTEGRQATIIAHCLNGARAAARAALADSTPTQPWEQQVATCLTVMCTDPDEASTCRDITAMIRHFRGHEPVPGYAVFRVQLGLTVTTLATATDPDAANLVLTQVAAEAIEAGDGYAARDVLRYRSPLTGPTDVQRDALSELVASSGLGSGTIPQPLRDSLISSAQAATEALAESIPQSQKP
ncbi:MAG: hypothetical protein ACT4NY_25855 [Pseudonocardiales bacterium]